ncbi:hypothetical protein [Bradyrhizobium sp.]
MSASAVTANGAPLTQTPQERLEAASISLGRKCKAGRGHRPG